MPGIIPSNPTRFPSGVNNTPMPFGNHPTTLYYLGEPDPTAFQRTFDDFNVYSATGYTVTGTGAVAQATGTNNIGGAVTLTNTAVIAEATSLQQATFAYQPVVNKRCFFKCRINIDNPILMGLCVGLTNAAPTQANAITDGIYLFKAGATDANLSAFVRKDATTGSNSLTGLAGLVAGYNTLGWHFDGKQSVEFFINEVKVATVSAATAFLPDAPLSPVVAIFNGSAVIRVAILDYMFAITER